MHEANSFITLTYNDECLPWDQSLNHKHFQDFMKRLRKKLAPKKIRFYMCGEYGPAFGRPHYHALIFGYDFPDKTFWRENLGNRIYRSELLEKLWPFGFSDIGEVTYKSAAYVARYIMKKVTGDRAEEHYWKLNTQTGETVRVIPEYTSMSGKPGIGKTWYDAYQEDTKKDYLTFDGKKFRIPKYYDKLTEKYHAKQFSENRRDRILEARKHEANNTPERRAVREICLSKKLSNLHRPFEQE